MSHFYTEIDSVVHPRYFVPMAKDPSRLRAATVSDAKKALKAGEIWYPSVTTILNVLDKAALINWKVDQHLQTAFESPMTGEDLETWMREIKRLTQERMDLAPQAGTDVHDILEQFMLTGQCPDEYALICKNVEKALIDNCSTQDWEVEKAFVSYLGYAGKVDLISKEWVVDYKTKQTADKFKVGKMAYVDHARQLAAYDMGITKYGAGRRCANIFICIETGEVDFHEHSSEALDDGWQDFKDALSIYKRNVFNPRG